MSDDALLTDISSSLEELQDELIRYETLKTDDCDTELREALQLFMRRAHSLKGKLQLAEHPESSTLIHCVESLISAHIKTEEKLSKDSIDLIFDCVDSIAACLLSKREDTSRLFMMSSRIQSSLQAAQAAQITLRGFPFAVTQAEYNCLDQARQLGQRVYYVEKAIRTDLTESVFKQLPILQDLAAAGAIVTSRPPFQDIGRRGQEAIVTFVAVTRLSRDELDLMIFDPWTFCKWPDPPQQKTGEVKAAPPSHPEPAHKATLRRMLIVEDDLTSRILLCEMLRRFGDSQVACDGREALAMVERALEKSQGYELVCLDIMLPELDGVDVLKELRRLEDVHGIAAENKAKVVMTTALSDYEHFHGAFANACDSYLVKPLSKAALNRQLTRLGITPGSKSSSSKVATIWQAGSG